MKTLNSISGGMTSSFLCANYPADFNVFALVTTNDVKCKYPDAKIRQIVSDKIGREFIGTLEDDMIIHTILDLEQYTGNKINWVAGKTFDEVIKNKKNYFLPNVFNRFCTFQMKIEPIKKFWFENIKEPIETRIGFRANEQSRAMKMLKRCETDGFLYEKFIVEKRLNGRNKWKKMKYQKPKFPLIEDKIFKDEIVNFWKNKNVKFANQNNCVGCFHRNEILLNFCSNKQPEKFNWFIDAEKKANATFKKNISYEKIKNYKLQIELFDDDFNDCDSGNCGI